MKKVKTLVIIMCVCNNDGYSVVPEFVFQSTAVNQIFSPLKHPNDGIQGI